MGHSHPDGSGHRRNQGGQQHRTPRRRLLRRSPQPGSDRLRAGIRDEAHIAHDSVRGRPCEVGQRRGVVRAVPAHIRPSRQRHEKHEAGDRTVVQPRHRARHIPRLRERPVEIPRPPRVDRILRADALRHSRRGASEGAQAPAKGLARQQHHHDRAPPRPRKRPTVR